MKKVISVGFNIPGCEKCYQDYLSKHSLFDADIIVFKPFSFDQYIQNVSQIVLLVPHLQGLDEQYGKEMREILADGKNIFLFMGEYQEIGGYNNYGFLPIRQKMVIISRKGSEIKFSNERIFCTFWKELNSYLNYECYIDYPHNPINRIFTTNSSDKLLGGILSYGLGNLIFLPMIKFPDDSKQAEGLGKRLIQILVDIDKSLRSKSEKTPSPEWLNSSIYTLTSESEIEKKMDSVSQEIDALNEKMDNLQTLLSDERSLKDLLLLYLLLS